MNDSNDLDDLNYLNSNEKKAPSNKVKKKIDREYDEKNTNISRSE